MNICVTGATGFIGQAIVLHLKQKGLTVTALAREMSQTKDLRQNSIPVITGDILDQGSLKRAFQHKDAVVHCAGHVTDWGKKKDFLTVNYLGTKNVLETCVTLGISRVIHLSTVDVFGHGQQFEIDENSPLEATPGWYGKSKVMAEILVREYIKEKKLDISTVYPPWVYGEGDRHFLPEIIDALKTGKMMFFRNRGRHRLEICYVKNLAQAVFTILTNRQSIGEGYIIADEPRITMREFCNTIADKLDYRKVNFTLGYPAAYFAALLFEGLYKLVFRRHRPLLTRQAVSLLGNDIHYNTNKIKALGYVQPYSFAQAIDRTLEDYKS